MDALKKSLGEEKFAWYEKKRENDTSFRKKIYEILNFMDGKHTIYDITRDVAAEYGETKAR